MSIRTFGGQWLLAGAGVATSDDCCCGDDTPPVGACCVDGECSSRTQEQCLALGGTWKGADTSCDDYDCTQGCCEQVDPIDPGCGSICVPGYNPSECFTGACIPGSGVAQPESGTTNCEGGTPTSVTVTGSGFTDPFGALPAGVVDCVNASYNVDLNCFGNSGTVRFSCGSYDVDVSVGVGASRTASISVLGSGTVLAGLSLTAAAESSASTDCGFPIYPCSPYSGPATSVFGGTGGDVDVS